jgi:undecaprenyl-diphosphatase
MAAEAIVTAEGELPERSEESLADQPWWKSTWPLGRRELVQLVVAFVLVVGVFTAVGTLVTDTWAPNVITDLDQDIAESLADGRTPARTDAAHWGAFPAETVTKIIASAVLVAALLIVWRRWHEPLLIAVTLIFEASAFIVVTHLVGRPRPDVPRLLDSPVTSSYPSGHVAAATVYLAVAIIVAWNTRSKWLPAVVAVLIAGIVVAVGWARMYQGMHHLSDVVAGILLGLVTLWICTYVISHSSRSPRRPSSPMEATRHRGDASRRQPPSQAFVAGRGASTVPGSDGATSSPKPDSRITTGASRP